MTEPGLSELTRTLLQAVVLAIGVGWVADQLVATGVRVRGLGLIAGFVGVYAGSWLWQAVGWPHGPSLAGHPLIPAFAGAIAVCAVVKIFGAGIQGSRS